MPPYRYTLTDRAFQTFAVCTDDEARALLLAIEMLALNPSPTARYFGLDSERRSIPWMEAGSLLVGYFVDHAEKQKSTFSFDIRRIESADD